MQLQPVSINGIEFDALIDDVKTMSSTIPTYPVEDGYPVSDNIMLNPIQLQMTLYVSRTPVTWLYRHGSSASRVKGICDQLENMWTTRQLVKIVTSDTIYTDMGITSISIEHTAETGYDRRVSISAQKVYTTSKKTVAIPAGLLKSGTTGASAGTASTSETSNSAASKKTASEPGDSSGKKAQSLLYGAAKGLSLI